MISSFLSHHHITYKEKKKERGVYKIYTLRWWWDSQRPNPPSQKWFMRDSHLTDVVAGTEKSHRMEFFYSSDHLFLSYEGG